MNVFSQNPDSSRSQQKAETASAILEAARDEFERVGFEGANIRSIAKQAGVSPGNVLHHFKDKKELLHAALFDELDRALRRALRFDPARPLLEDLGRFGRAVFKSYQARPTLSRTLLKESMFADGPWRARFLAQVADVQRALAERIGKTPELARSANPELLAAGWLSFFYFALIGWAQGAMPRPVELVEHLTAHHLAPHLKEKP